MRDDGKADTTPRTITALERLHDRGCRAYLLPCLFTLPIACPSVGVERPVRIGYLLGPRSRLPGALVPVAPAGQRPGIASVTNVNKVVPGGELEQTGAVLERILHEQHVLTRV